MIRVYARTGRRTGVSVPLWLALLGYLLIAAAIWTIAIAVGLVVLLVVALFLLAALGAAGVGSVRRRRRQRLP